MAESAPPPNRDDGLVPEVIWRLNAQISEQAFQVLFGGGENAAVLSRR
jgi:hypothetical protein